jgi:hypothetical protein
MQRTMPAVLAGLFCLVMAAFGQANAQVAGQGPSFIKPFPNNETYRLKLVGDWFADGLRASVAEALAGEGEIRVAPSVVQVRSLRSSGWNSVVGSLEEDFKREPADIAVVMFGAAEIGSLGIPGKRRLRFRTDEWKTHYAARVDRMMKAMSASGAAVYWLGMPTLRREDRNDGAQFINEIVRERAYLNGIKFIDVYAGFANEDGDFDDYGPDLEGKIMRLRSRDGVYFTTPGYRKLAHYATRLITRDLRRAKSERTVPLAGSEIEQQRISPQPDQGVGETANDGGDASNAEQPALSRRIASNATSGPSPIAPVPGLKDQKADDSTIALRTIVDGVARTEKIKILRPAISANLLALLTRRNTGSRATQFGDNLAVELPGGIMLLNSVTAVNRGPLRGGSGQLSASQSPFFKVWAKGERLTPRPGRADDLQWPRPEPTPVVRANYVPQANATAGGFRPVRRKYTPDGFPPLPDRNPLAR